MSNDARITMHPALAALLAVVLLVTGAALTYLLVRRDPVPHGQMSTGETPVHTHARRVPDEPSVGSSPPPADVAPLPDVVVPLTPEAVERAGIIVAPASAGTSRVEIRLPGIVEPNIYRQVTVTPLVGGRVTRVSAELGERVRRGQAMAQIYSPELADAYTRYISARARLEAHDRELQRTEKLVEIGAASRQELERIHAEHAAQTAEVESARSRLELLGAPMAAREERPLQPADATIVVPAPLDGVVTERAANVGLNVEPATSLFTIVDLSTVWVVADAYETDVSRVHVGDTAAITTAAHPERAVRGRVSYIDPQLNPVTRTARLRIEVPNPGGVLKLGMYADVVLTGASGVQVTMIPRGAVQNVGDRTLVYLASPDRSNAFIEREVRLGRLSNGQVEVVSGVQAGDLIVTAGSFFVRAERERLGLRPAPASAAADDSQDSARPGGAQADVQSARIVVDDRGYQPARVTLRAGEPARLTFVRTSDATCGTEIVFPTLNIRRELPLNEPVVIELEPGRDAELTFACGMDMLRGIVVTQ